MEVVRSVVICYVGLLIRLRCLVLNNESAMNVVFFFTQEFTLILRSYLCKYVALLFRCAITDHTRRV